MWHDEISGLNEKEIEEVAKEFIEVSTKTLIQLETVYNFLYQQVSYKEYKYFLKLDMLKTYNFAVGKGKKEF